jgi:CubicO group peptidase (beta-lactamase class C family)
MDARPVDAPEAAAPEAAAPKAAEPRLNAPAAAALRVDARKVDQIAGRFAGRGGQPGVAYGVVADGQLVHAGGLGEAFVGGPAPQADTVFRIASMTKSFTASAVMLLRDDGVLRLDDPAHQYLPELRGLRLPAADCQPVTIRQLLTMTAGFPTDDPWGDRQQGLPLDSFDELISSGQLRCCWAPGTRFEYSNLGYALLGRVISAVTGSRYETAVRDMLLAPLGLDRTGFEAGEFAPDNLARGYRRDESGGWLELQPAPSGAFASMGGVFSCVGDLARWVAGFADAFPSRSAPESGHPLRRSSRRDMQLAQVAVPSGGGMHATRFGGPAALSYGFGLFAEDDARFGTVIQHSGGYPGYGSQMRWHPATGIGVIVLANSTYAGVGALAGEALAALLADHEAAAAPGSRRLRGPVPAQLAQPGEGGARSAGPPATGPPATGPWADTLAAMAAVNELLRHWDEAAADALFAPNVAQDRPLPQRRDDIARLRARIGDFGPDAARAVECDSPAHCRWWLAGERGRASVQIRLAPLAKPVVQQLIVAVPPEAGSALDQAIRILVAALNDGAREWPPGLPAAAGTDHILRQLRLAAAWTGPCARGGWLAGDGSTTATIELIGPSGRAALSVEVDRAGLVLQRADVSPLS